MNAERFYDMLLTPSALAMGDNEYNNMMGTLLGFFNDFLIPTLLTIATGVFLVLIIINGIKIARASTDEEKTKAKKALIGQVVGMLVCFVGIWLVPAFIDFLKAIFGADVTLEPIR